MILCLVGEKAGGGDIKRVVLSSFSLFGYEIQLKRCPCKKKKGKKERKIQVKRCRPPSQFLSQSKIHQNEKVTVHAVLPNSVKKC